MRGVWRGSEGVWDGVLGGEGLWGTPRFPWGGLGAFWGGLKGVWVGGVSGDLVGGGGL